VGLTGSTRDRVLVAYRQDLQRFRRPIESGYTEALLADLFEQRVGMGGQTVVVAGPEHRKAGKLAWPARSPGARSQGTLHGTATVTFFVLMERNPKMTRRWPSHVTATRQTRSVTSGSGPAAARWSPRTSTTSYRSTPSTRPPAGGTLG
jgi:hypothetical protein